MPSPTPSATGGVAASCALGPPSFSPAVAPLVVAAAIAVAILPASPGHARWLLGGAALQSRCRRATALKGVKQRSRVRRRRHAHPWEVRVAQRSIGTHHTRHLWASLLPTRTCQLHKRKPSHPQLQRDPWRRRHQRKPPRTAEFAAPAPPMAPPAAERRRALYLVLVLCTVVFSM